MPSRHTMGITGCLLFLCALPMAAADKPDLTPISTSEVVFLGKLKTLRAGPAGLSDPPIWTFDLEFEVAEQWRGAKPTGRMYYRIQQPNQPEFPLNTIWIVAARKNEQRWNITFLAAAKPALVESAKVLAGLPSGWKIEGEKILSPWASVKGYQWPANAPKPAGAVCAVTGRPALLAGEKIEFTVTQVPPKNPQKFKNDYGDGLFEVSVKNTSDQLVEVPALLTDGQKILWEESIVFCVQGQPKLLPGAGKSKNLQPVRLRPGEKVSGTINTLLLDGVEWPRGGWRVYFDFCLGEKSTSNFFYYFSAWHDRLRAEALKQLGNR